MDNREYLQNALGEVVEVIEQPDGTALAILEGEATRTFSSYDKALDLLYRAGWRF